MGMFSWKCKGCGHDLKTDEIVRMNGSVGEYNGYGCAGGFDASQTSGFQVVAWHELCYWRATPEDRANEDFSEDAENQGFGEPNPDFMNPQRVLDAKIAAKVSVSKPGGKLATAFPLVRYDCGCIGMPPAQDGSALIIECCDTDVALLTGWWASFVFQVRDEMGEKNYVPLTEDEYGGKMMNIRGLVGDGKRLNEIKSLLK